MTKMKGSDDKENNAPELRGLAVVKNGNLLESYTKKRISSNILIHSYKQHINIPVCLKLRLYTHSILVTQSFLRTFLLHSGSETCM